VSFILYTILKRRDARAVRGGKITQPAKLKFDNANIAWAEYVPENIFMESEAEELE